MIYAPEITRARLTALATRRTILEIQTLLTTTGYAGAVVSLGQIKRRLAIDY